MVDIFQWGIPYSNFSLNLGQVGAMSDHFGILNDALIKHIIWKINLSKTNGFQIKL